MIRFIFSLLFAFASAILLFSFCAKTPENRLLDCRSKLEKTWNEMEVDQGLLRDYSDEFERLHNGGLRQMFLGFLGYDYLEIPDEDAKEEYKRLEREMMVLEAEIDDKRKDVWDAKLNLSQREVSLTCQDSLREARAVIKRNRVIIDGRQSALDKLEDFRQKVQEHLTLLDQNFAKKGSPKDHEKTANPSSIPGPNYLNPGILKSGFGTIGNRDYSIDYYIVDDKKESVYLASFDGDTKRPLRSIKNVNEYFSNASYPPRLIMNGGMYDPDLSAKGLYVAGGKEYSGIDLSPGNPKVLQNFYLLPNGIYYVDESGQGGVTETQEFSKKKYKNLASATQSGPMLIINGIMHPKFNEGSPNVNIRNGVGILPDGRTIYAITNNAINFYTFASFFQGLGCKNALYLDGVVSRMYEPMKRPERGDNLGVFIVVTDRK